MSKVVSSAPSGRSSELGFDSVRALQFPVRVPALPGVARHRGSVVTRVSRARRGALLPSRLTLSLPDFATSSHLRRRIEPGPDRLGQGTSCMEARRRRPCWSRVGGVILLLLVAYMVSTWTQDRQEGEDELWKLSSSAETDPSPNSTTIDARGAVTAMTVDTKVEKVRGMNASLTNGSAAEADSGGAIRWQSAIRAGCTSRGGRLPSHSHSAFVAILADRLHRELGDGRGTVLPCRRDDVEGLRLELHEQRDGVRRPGRRWATVSSRARSWRPRSDSVAADAARSRPGNGEG